MKEDCLCTPFSDIETKSPDMSSELSQPILDKTLETKILPTLDEEKEVDKDDVPLLWRIKNKNKQKEIMTVSPKVVKIIPLRDHKGNS